MRLMAVVGAGALFACALTAGEALAAEPTPMEKCETWRAQQQRLATTEGRPEGTTAERRCVVAGAVFYINSGFGEGAGGAQGPAYANIRIDRCEPSLANEGICHAVWRDSMGRLRTMTIPVNGDTGSVFEQGVGPAGQGPSLSEVVRRMEQERVQEAMALWNDGRDASAFTPEAFDQITHAFGEQDAALSAREEALRAETDRYLQSLPEHLRGASIEELRRMGQYLVPYASDANAAARNLELLQSLQLEHAELISSAEQALRAQGPLNVPVVVEDVGTVPSSFTSPPALSSPASQETAGTGGGWWSSTVSTVQGWASSAWYGAQNFNCLVRKWANAPQPGDSC